MDPERKIFLVNPPLALGRSYLLAPPVGLLVVAAAMEERGYSHTGVIDLALEFLEKKLPAGKYLCQAAAERLAELDGDTYGFSVQCVNLPLALDIARRLSALRPESRIIFGGHHSSLLKERLINHFPYITEVVSGPGEQWITSTGPANNRWLMPAYSKAAGWQRYARVSPQPTGIVEVARGCPFSCSFCSIPLAFGHRVTRKPVEMVLAEVSYLVGEGCEEIHFVDDVFTLDHNYVHQLIAGLRREKMEISWTAMTRVDLVSPALLQSMKEAGCHSILYGVESASVQTRDSVRKLGRGYPDLIEFAQWHVEAGLRPKLYFLINLPTDTAPRLHETLTVASRLSVIDPGSCHFQLPRFVPGTPLAEQSRGQMTFDIGTQYADTLCQTVGEDAHEVWAFVKNYPELCSTYYTAPGPLAHDTANALAWTGDHLFEEFPLTMAALGEGDSLLDLFRHLGSIQTGRGWVTVSKDELTGLLEGYLSAKAKDLLDIARFERWLKPDASASGDRACPRYYISQVDLAAARGAALDSSLSIRPTLAGRPKVYERYVEE